MRSKCLSLALIFSCISWVHADERRPLPEKAAQTEADAVAQDVYGKEISNANTNDKKTALSNKLVDASRSDTSDDDRYRYALLKAALKTAPDALAAMPIVDEIAKHFQIDPLQEKATVVWLLWKDVDTPAQRSALAEVALQLVGESVRRDS